MRSVRPEHAELRADGEWPLKVDVLEMLGAERLVYGHLGGSAFTVRLEATLTPPRPGDTVHLHVPRVHLHRGAAETTVWTCDLSHDYVSINAVYRS